MLMEEEVTVLLRTNPFDIILCRCIDLDKNT